VSPDRFQSITGQYSNLRLAVVGDFCLDRYLEIDPSKQEISIETNLPVHNVVRVRPQPGGAGTILNNLSALGVGTIYAIGFAGEDGEGFELSRELNRRQGVRLDHFVRSTGRRTFTYCKPLLVAPNKPPVELNRLDSKNWTETPADVQGMLIRGLEKVAAEVQGIIVLDQVGLPETGVVTRSVLEAVGQLADRYPELLILADSRRGLRGYPPVVFKMNASELGALTSAQKEQSLDWVKEKAGALAHKNGRSVFVTLAGGGIVGATAAGEVQHVLSLPLRGEIDIVGAGDAVSANLATAIASGATLLEALELANAAASVVIHQLGTTGSATVGQIAEMF
jgi:rfaE bifunctional protein kinase chain/domain